MLEQALQAALNTPGVSVLTLPGDVGGLDVPKGTASPTVVAAHPPTVPDAEALDRAATLIDEAETVTLLVGIGAREARDEVLGLAERLQAPMVLSLKAKEGLEKDNPYEVGQSGLIGNPAAHDAFDGGDVLLMIGTDFPYREWYPERQDGHPDRRASGAHRPAHAGRPSAWSATRRRRCARCSRASPRRSRRRTSTRAETPTQSWRKRQSALTDPDFDQSLIGRVREKFDNTSERIRPEALAQAVDRHAAPDAVFTTDTGMSTVWLSRFVTMSDRRALLGSFNLGSMANAMPQALGAQALDRARQVVAFCGDGGLSMLLGDLITAVSYQLPVKLIVFDNGRLGHGQARTGAGRAARVRHRAAQPGLRRRGARDRPARRACRGSGRRSTARCATRSPTTVRCCSTC